MVLITKENKTYNYPINLQPTDPSEYTLEVYSHMSKTTTTFTGLTGVVVDDFVGIEMTDTMLSKLPNGEYDYTVYDNDQTRVSIGLLRVDLEQQGEEDEPEYVVYHDEMDGYITTKDMTEYQEEIEELEEEIVIKDAIISGLQEQIDSVTATTISFNGTFTPAEGTLGWNSVDVQVEDYFWIETNSAITIEFKRDANTPEDVPIAHLEYSINKGEWVDWDLAPVALNAGDRIYLRGNNTIFHKKNSGAGYHFITSYNREKDVIKIGGRIVSLIDKTMQQTNIPDGCFAYLFLGIQCLYDCEKDLFKGFTSVGEAGCVGMFQNCLRFGLNAPDLPMTTIGRSCYAAMFQECRRITKAPELPATTLAPQCYRQMFFRTAITETPYLPATTIANYAYQQMFGDCASLNKVHCAAIVLSGTTNWLQNVSSGGTFIKDINATGWTMDSPNGIPSGWTVLNDNVLLQSTAITSNGTYVPQSGAAFDNVVVNVPTGITPSGELAISGNGTYNVTQYASASVNVPTGITPTGQIAISGNGTYNVTQYASANVNVESIPDWGVYTPPIFSGSTHLENRPFGFYLENVPANYTLSFKIAKNGGGVKRIIIDWGDGNITTEAWLEQPYVSIYPEHTYTSDFSGWVTWYNFDVCNLSWGYGQNPWGNIFDYCKAMYVDNSEYGTRNGGSFAIGLGGGYPISISNSVTHFYAYDPLTPTYQYTYVLDFLHRGLVKAQVDATGYQYANDIPLKHIYYRCS